MVTIPADRIPNIIYGMPDVLAICRFEDGFGVFLPPVGTSPHVMASLLLHFFYTLPEPLLTFKYAHILLCPKPNLPPK